MFQTKRWVLWETLMKIRMVVGILKVWNWDFLFPLLSKSKKYLHENWKHCDNNLFWHLGWVYFYSLSLCLGNWLKLSLFSRSLSKDSIGGAKVEHFSFFQSPCQIGLYTRAQNVCPGRPVYKVKCLCSRGQEWGREGRLPLPPAFPYLILMTWRACDLSLVMISSLN